ncbi:hypothetical protein D9Q98_000628 [Chlorella vulgaris]|uniref:Uncharacterized protein n=1 Tax=Chlorella vulgaris TaxID=3077 RepID=A0A9D4Z2E3_CHLVU|nr:hypothetical protein D9Q98_000628 [Chlorella vulgaris]
MAEPAPRSHNDRWQRYSPTTPTKTTVPAALGHHFTMSRPRGTLESDQQRCTAIALAPPSDGVSSPSLPNRPASARTSSFVEKLVANIQQQQTRQQKRMHQLQAASVARATKQRESDERLRRDRQRELELEQARAQQADASYKRAARAEAHRRERLAAAQSHSEELQRQAAAKLEQGALRAAAAAAERQDEAGLARAKHVVSAARRVDDVRRRASLEAADKARAVELRREQHEQAARKAQQERRAVEAARRTEEERRDLGRRQALVRAEQDQAERAAYYLQRQRQKVAELQQRGVELAALRALKQQEHSMRAACARHRVELAAQRVEERQAQLSSKLAEKQRRVAAMEDERAAMLRALEDVRREIRRQEAQLKQALQQMEGGHPASLGRLGDLQQQLAGLLLQQPGTPLARKRVSHHLALPPPSSKATIAAGPGQEETQAAGCKEPAGLTTVMQDAGSAGASLCDSQASSSMASPRIAAVHAPLESDGSGQLGQAGSGVGTSQPSDSTSSLPPSIAQACSMANDAEQQKPQASHLSASQVREKLQRVLAMEMAREAERAAVLRGVQQDRDRTRLLHFFEVERCNAMAVMQQLQQQLH